IGSTVTHAYSSAGTFTVVLTAKDSGSLQQTATSQQALPVTSPPPPLTTSFSYSPLSPEAGQQVAFTASASGGATLCAFSWSFGVQLEFRRWELIRDQPCIPYLFHAGKLHGDVDCDRL